MERISYETLYELSFASEPITSPDGRSFAYVHTMLDKVGNGYRSVIRLVDLETLEDRIITQGGANIGQAFQDKNPRFSSDGKQLAFLSTRNDKSQLYVMPTTGGEARQVTWFDDDVKSFDWSPDGQSLVVATRSQTHSEASKEEKAHPRKSSEQALQTGLAPAPDMLEIYHLRHHGNGEGYFEGKPMHLWIVELDSGDVHQLTSGPFNEKDPVFSPDGRFVAFVSWRSEQETEVLPSIYTVSVNSGEITEIYQGRGQTMAPSYAPNGESIVFFGHQEGEISGANTCVWLVPVQGGEAKCLTESLDRPQGTQVGTDSRAVSAQARPIWSADSSTIYFIATKNGNAHVYSVSPGGEVKRETLSDACVATGLAVIDKDTFVVTEEWPTSPAEVVRYQSGLRQQITCLNQALASEYEVVTHETFNIIARDGWEIPGWIMRPVDFDVEKKYPLILEIHGGPHSSYGNTFCHEFQLLAAQGFVVLYMNPRGSHGYGDQFVKACVGDWGGSDYNDLMDAVDQAIQLPYVDENQLFVTGGSYGGFMTNWIVGHTHRFKAAVTQRCISNLYSMFGTSDIGFWFNKAELGGRDLWDSEEFIMERSPIRHAKNVKTPTKIIHSEADYRCPMEQAEQWFTALKRLNVDTELIRFASENHELSRSGKPANRIARLKHIVSWFEKYRTKSGAGNELLTYKA